MTERPIYLDHHATTPLDPRVLEAMLPWFSDKFGNAASASHAYGWEAKQAVEQARSVIAAAIGASPREIVFTSGATESNNLAIRGVCEHPRCRGRHLVSVATEHRAVLDPLARLQRRGFEVTLLPVAPAGRRDAGRVDLDQLAATIRDDTALVSVMLANSEIGVLQPLDEIAAICGERGVLLHTDATQAVGKIPVGVDAAVLGADLISFSAHKIYGPKGIGALCLRRREPRVRLEPQIDGGRQEGGLRSGTLNVPGIVGFARALTLCIEELPREMPRQQQLRDRLYAALAQGRDGVALNGPALDDPGLRLPNNLNCRFAGVDGESLLLSVPGLAVSSGSACTSAEAGPSHVLRALGLDDEAARASLRFGLGRFTTEGDIERAAELLIAAVARLRALGTEARS